MKLPARLRSAFRTVIGFSSAPRISPEQLGELAATEPVVVLALSAVGSGSTDPRLPGEQRASTLSGLAEAVADLPRDRAIVTHCS